MNFEEYQQKKVAPLVDEVFEEVSSMSVPERMVIASFDLLPYVESERRAEMEAFKAWIDSGGDAQISLRAMLSAFGEAALRGLESLGRAFMVGANDAAPTEAPKQRPPAEPLDEEVLLKEDALQKANIRIANARSMMSTIYRLTPREVRIAEAIARNPDRIERL